MSRQHGFTLIELMDVILIIGILIAIAVPVFFAAQVNAKAAACKDNLRTIASIINVYYGKEGSYPDATILTNTDYLLKEPNVRLAPLPMSGTHLPISRPMLLAPTTLLTPTIIFRKVNRYYARDKTAGRLKREETPGAVNTGMVETVVINAEEEACRGRAHDLL